MSLFSTLYVCFTRTIILPVQFLCALQASTISSSTPPYSWLLRLLLLLLLPPPPPLPDDDMLHLHTLCRCLCVGRREGGGKVSPDAAGKKKQRGGENYRGRHYTSNILNLPILCGCG